MTEKKRRFAVAVVERTHGLDGRLRAKSLSGSIDHLLALRKVDLVRAGRTIATMEIESISGHGDRLTIKFAAVDTAEAAERFARAEVWVEREFAQPLGVDEYYAADLHGCVVHMGGERIGRVTGVWESGSSAMVDVELVDGRRAVIPLVSEHVGEIDVERGRIELRSRWLIE